MTVYLIANIEVKAGGMPALKGAIGEMIPILETAGWRLASAFSMRTGQVGVVMDIWEMPDFNALDLGLAAVAKSPRFSVIQAALQDSILRETLTFADKLDYPVVPG